MKSTLMWKEINEQPKVISKCIEQNSDLLECIGNKIKERNISKIIIAARGSSDHIAIFAKYLFEIYYHLPVSLSAPSVFTAYGSRLEFSDSIVIAISQSGAAEDVNAVVKHANSCGALTIGITNNSESLIAEEVDYHVDCLAGEEKSVAATKTLTAQMCIITMLASKITHDKEIENSITKLSKAVNYALSIAERVREIANRYRFMEECFVLSRGICFPVGKEAALKIQETSYIKAQAYPISDFMHGPIAMIEDNTPCIIIGVDKNIISDIYKVSSRLVKENADVFMITNEPELTKNASVSILLPDWCEGVLGAFSTVVISQLLAGYIAIGRGNNPDKPRGLNKVTITK